MIRKAILAMGMLAIASGGYAQSIQPCATDEFYREQKAAHPGIAAQEAKLKAELDKYMFNRFGNAKAKTAHHDGTPTWVDDTRQFHIPVVVHVISDYGPGVPYITDNDIYGMMSRLNAYYNGGGPSIPNGVIPPFRPYIGNARITFHLATKDPSGKPSRGITRHYSHLATGGDELAKIGTWAPDQYLNIYLENFIGRVQPPGVVLAYATFPTSYADNPYSQGVISRADQAFANPGVGDVATLAHEVGHYLSLYHVWNSNGAAVEAGGCGDDEVDDTPPTKGHFSCTNANLYDTVCAKGYVKFYDGETAYHMFGDSLASSKLKNYPDTTNTQNIMDYSGCPTQMFTHGQVARMRATLRSNVGYRSNLVDTFNLFKTGIWDANNNFIPAPDVAPIADFSVNRNFVCADDNTNVLFSNRSYNDTADIEWTFSNGANFPESIANSLNNTFEQPGWVNVTLKASSNAGTSTITRNNIVYAADPVAKNPSGYYMEFNTADDAEKAEVSKFPIFNYFGTDHKWEVVNDAGYFDKTSIRYSNYDKRSEATISNASQSPRGDYSDFFTPAFDLSGFTGTCNLSFFTSGAFRTSKPREMNDRLEVAVSSDCGLTWRTLDSLKEGKIGNNGYRTDEFKPMWPTDWKEQSVPINVRGSQTFFRFRFRAGVADPNLAIYGFFPYYGFGTGNNFYLDRIHITNTPLGVQNGVIVNLGMSVSPNPTSGAATISLNGGDNSVAEISVTDVTGKLVFRNSVTRSAATTRVEVPASAISVKGMYLVKVVTNGATETQKLVVY